ncbi:hypothetical protein BON30_09270 [Cystobacter ferrugineus]|uniref:DUF3396 domain-containing protein n=1 Tax=Cystobacter ferrugineus TaxID=83449 RepID=A0A1L9BHA8_9BACT|nr:hypothetical protein BON30_09270 [Cystobacter ferrugineus]
MSICFYFSHSHQDIAKHIRHALEFYLLAVGPNALAWYPDERGDLWELDDKGWAHIQNKLRDEGGGIVDLTDRPDAVSEYRLEYWGGQVDPSFPREVCAMAFWLPTEYMEEHGPGRVQELALGLGTFLPFCSGHAGLSLHRLGRTPGFQALCSSYPGMDRTEVGHLSWNLGTRINGTHWMNFLGPPVLGELGGASALRSRLSSPGTTVRELGEERAVVTLGEAPDAGDTGQCPALPAYRELARVLEPWLYHESYIKDEFTPEEMLHWERRFLD